MQRIIDANAEYNCMCFYMEMRNYCVPFLVQIGSMKVLSSYFLNVANTYVILSNCF